jgi:hypothetical protein
MNSRRVVAVLGALAVGIGVTLAGVVLADDEPNGGAETSVTEVVDDEQVRQEEVDVVEPDEAEVSEVVPAEESPPSLPDEPSPTVPDTSVLPEDAKPDTAVDSDVERVECVQTIAVGYVDGARGDYVVVEDLGDSSYLVLDADGQFEISARDPNVEELLLVARNVRFFQDAAVNFLDVCADLGGDEGGIGGDIESFGEVPSATAESFSTSWRSPIDQKRAR